MAVISLRGLTKNYGNTTAVDNVDLDIEAGEVFGLLGPNGAGKTTTILMLLGLTEPTSGSVEVIGLDPRRNALDVKSAIGYLPDDVGFYENLTARQNLRYTARLNRLDTEQSEERIDEVLELVGLTDAADRAVGGYSRGMQQRLGLADALVKNPSVLILDEPTVNIDPEGVADMLAIVRRLAAEGVTILLSSHLLHQVQAVCDRIGIFVEGQLAAVGTVDELAQQLDDRFVVEVEATEPIEELTGRVASMPTVTDVTVDPSGRLVVSATHDVRAAIADSVHDRGHRVLHLRRRSAELDAIYSRYFSQRPSSSGAAERHSESEEVLA